MDEKTESIIAIICALLLLSIGYGMIKTPEVKKEPAYDPFWGEVTRVDKWPLLHEGGAVIVLTGIFVLIFGIIDFVEEQRERKLEGSERRTCPYCGGIIQKSAEICPQCQTKIRTTTNYPTSCPNCNSKISSEDNFCKECGERISKPSKQKT